MTPAKFKVIVARRQTNEEHNQCYNYKPGEMYSQ